MHILISLLGVALIAGILWDAFEAIVLPRRVTRRLRPTRIFYAFTWSAISIIATKLAPGRRRERFLGFFGPLSLILLITLWGLGLVFAFAVLHAANGSRERVPWGLPNFGSDLYLSGTTFFTLGLGDVVPLSGVGRALTVIEAGMGFGFLAIVIGYLPVIYQSFSRRELNVSLLDARAGSPPSASELMRRHGKEHFAALEEFLGEWELWSADLLESHLSYPALAYFRSQHENQSWLAALATILDTCSLIMVGIRGVPAWQARMTFAMARHAIVDLAQIYDTPPSRDGEERLYEADLARVREVLNGVGLTLNDGPDTYAKLAEFRKMYEPYLKSMGERLFMSLPPWIHRVDVVDNWQTSAWERNTTVFASSPAPLRGFDGTEGNYPD